ncbi:MAG: hypothetical protein BGO54_17430 [Sphingobacteriales bacterium 46-32]|nr:MAG: hypothetical protein BGO54_17430 [Sphingobacteriales bacterium 46-32]
MSVAIAFSAFWPRNVNALNTTASANTGMAQIIFFILFDFWLIIMPTLFTQVFGIPWRLQPFYQRPCRGAHDPAQASYYIDLFWTIVS